jgi:uncharacterized protein (DUF433 family)
MVQPDVISRDPEVLGGIPVFPHTRVPIQSFFDYLEHDHSIEEVPDDFPLVQRDQAVAVLEASRRFLLTQPA